MPPESLRCKECKTTYPLEARYVCEQLLRPARGRVRLARRSADPAELKRRIQAGPHSLWRYGDFLPVSAPPKGTLPAGFTPLLRVDRLAERLGLERAVDQERRRQPDALVQGPGRVGRARAGPRARLRDDRVRLDREPRERRRRPRRGGGARVLRVHPADLEEQKVLATGVYGTNLVAVRGNYDDVNRLCTELSGEHEWAFVNINMRPYYAEGSKTLAFETAEQLGFELPDRVVAPIASGSLFTKIARGFEEWLEVGLVEGELPTFNGAQAAGCSPVATAFEDGQDFCRPVKPDTIAKSLAIGNPADGPYALDLARRTGGSIDSVTDDEIREGIKLLAQTTGIFTETAGGVDRRGAREARRARRHRPRRAGRRVHHRRGAEDARLRPRDVRGVGDRADASSRSSRPASAPSPPLDMTSATRWPSASRSRPSSAPPPTARRPPRSSGDTVGEVLDALYERYGELRSRIAEDGGLRRFVNVYVGGEDIRFLDGLDTPVSDGDEVTILPAVAGG